MMNNNYYWWLNLCACACECEFNFFFQKMENVQTNIYFIIIFSNEPLWEHPNGNKWHIYGWAHEHPCIQCAYNNLYINAGTIKVEAERMEDGIGTKEKTLFDDDGEDDTNSWIIRYLNHRVSLRTLTNYYNYYHCHKEDVEWFAAMPTKCYILYVCSMLLVACNFLRLWHFSLCFCHSIHSSIYFSCFTIMLE